MIIIQYTYNNPWRRISVHTLQEVSGQAQLQNSILWAETLFYDTSAGCMQYLCHLCFYSFLHDDHMCSLWVFASYFSLLFYYRTCRVLFSNRGQTWTRLEMLWVPCAGRIPLRSSLASPLTSPLLPSEQRLLLSAVPRPGAACRMGYSSTSMVRDKRYYIVHFVVRFCFVEVDLGWRDSV